MRPSRLLLGALAAAQLGYPRVRPSRRERATRAIVGLMLATSLADATEARGARRGLGTAALAAGIGFATELLGVATGRPFGHYRYGAGLGRRVGGVPLLAGAAWAMMARPAWVVAGLLTRRPAARAGLAAAALTAWDVFLDPRMVRDGYWSWDAGGAYEGVPLSNYAGWLATGGAVFAAWAALDPADDPLAPAARGRRAEVGHARARGGRQGDAALALYAWTLAGEAIANVLFWRRPRVAAAGTAAMGALALPALRARLSAGRA
jgi:putative membrane protein